MQLTEGIVKNVYNELVIKAKLQIHKNKTEKALLYVHLAAYTSHTFFLHNYYDQQLEDIVVQLSTRIHKVPEYVVTNNNAVRCVMLDSLSTLKGGLTTQYLRAIVSAGWHLLYVTEQPLKSSRHFSLYKELQSYSNITILEVPTNLKGNEKLQYVYDQIVKYNPSKLYLHLSPYDPFFSAVSYALPCEIIKYYIDYTDHSLALGIGSADYIFEFRNKGCSASVKYRGIDKERVLLHPFYPIIDKEPFGGFPEICKGKIIILSGGSYWKIIDKDDTYLNLASQILKKHKNAVILFPGGGEKHYINKRLAEYKIEDRFILMPWRKDICQLFEKCDIYFNTYPNSGGLMAQYAAHYSKPILSYQPIENGPNPVETLVCQIKYIQISQYGISDFMSEADKLIEDYEYRMLKGSQINSCVFGQRNFEKSFVEMSTKFKNLIPYVVKDDVVIREQQRNETIKASNENADYQMRMVLKLWFDSIIYKSYFIVPFVRKILPKVKRVFLNKK